MKKIIYILLLFPFLVRGQEKLTESNYRIYSVALGKEVSIKTIAQDMKDYDVLFFGEEHNDSVAHFLEKSIFELLQFKFTGEVALSLEMFDRDVQPVMNEYLKDFIREKNLIKDARAWNNYPDYKPLVSFAKQNKLDVICANAASRYAFLAGKYGQGKEGLKDLPAESKEFIAPLPYDTATGDYHAKLAEMSGHGPASTSDSARMKSSVNGFNLNTAQSLWDATMAYSISQYIKKNKTRKIFQINGKYHSDGGFGVVEQLKNYSAKTKVLIISSSIGDDNFSNKDFDWTKFKKDGDFIIITDPNIPRTYND